MVYTDSCGLCKNTLYYTHIYTGGKSMAEEIRFVSGQMPSLLYATKQIVAASAITRAIHRHERFTEMLYVYQGAGQYIAGGYSYPIRTGDILLYNQGDLHEVTSSLQHEIGTLCFGISGLQLCGLPEGHFTKAENGFVRPAMDEIDHMQSLSELIYEHAERRTSYSDEIVAQLLPALVLLSANLPPDARAADQPHNLVLANRIRQYIGTHFTEQLTLEDIGEAMSMSPYHLAHIFKEITGMSPIHYMIRCRVGEAQNLLISTDYSATQIAAIVGYTNVNHFNAIFAKLVGLPPIRYRRKYLENMQGSRLQYRNNRLFVDILSIYNGKEGESWRESALFAPAVEKANRARNASFSAKMRYATPAPRSTLRSATAAASGCTAEMHDKSITVPFVHNAVGKSITNPTESKCFQWDFRVLRRKLCLKIQSISHAACRVKYQTL